MGWNPPPHPFEPPIRSFDGSLGDTDQFTFYWSPMITTVAPSTLPDSPVMPPHGEDVASGRDQINAIYVLFDYVHDDGLMNWMSDDWTKVMLEAININSNDGPLDARLANRTLLAHFYLHPEDWKGIQCSDGSLPSGMSATSTGSCGDGSTPTYAGTGPEREPPNATYPEGQVLSGVLLSGPLETYGVSPKSNAEIDQRWQDLDVVVKAAVAARAALPALPANTYDDPITVYYYDTDTIKKQTYPGSSLAQAVDPTNNRWWAVSGSTTQDYDPNSGTWSDEGFNYDKDVSVDSIDQIIKILMLAIDAVLAFTGVGSALIPLVNLIGNVLISAISIAVSLVNQGDATGAMNQFGEALLSMIGSNLPAGGSKIITSTVLKAAGAALKMLAAEMDPQLHPENSDMATALQNVQNKVNEFPYVDEASTLALIQQMLYVPYGSEPPIVSGSATPPGEYALPFTPWLTFYAGYLWGQVGTPDQIAKVSLLLNQTGTGAAHALWLLGAHVGVLVTAQKSPTYVAPSAAIPLTPAVNLAMTGPTLAPQESLMSYVRGFLAPRYNIPS